MAINTAARPHAEFMRVWEEGYVGTRGMFEAMHMQGVGVFSGGDLRRSDGTLDRERIREWIASATRAIPYAHLRLMRSPLGLTPPAWVPDDAFDIDRHLRFADPVVSLSSASMPALVGWDHGALDPARPLWRLQFTALDDGRVALGVLMHHSGGDALRTLKFLAALTTSDPAARPTEGDEPFAGERAPRRGGELPFLSMRAWAASGTSASQLWRDYWHRSFIRRSRRVIGRMLRPLRDARAGRRGPMPPRQTGFRTVSGEAVQAAASAAGGTMNDIVVAAAIRAASADGAGVRVRVPVLRRRTEDSRNRVTDVAVVGTGAQPVEELVASVRAQLRPDGDDAPEADGSPARDVGYVTLVPWLSRARHLCGARLDDMIVLPAGLPTDELSTFALLYDSRLSVVATARSSVDLDAVMDRLELELTRSAVDVRE
ncbi:MAG: wax ester/triacylglycerol synthase domain-containing protein [Microbacterium sp.]